MQLSEFQEHGCFPLAFSLEGISLPEQFTFPFYYQPHPLAIAACQKLQHYLATQTDFVHPFGLMDEDENPIGKMFGVLVVQNPNGVVGFVAAFSGKLADSNNHPYFVPPVFDLLQEDSFFVLKEKEINHINFKLKTLEENPHYLALISEKERFNLLAKEEISVLKKEIQEAKAFRKEKRKWAKENLDTEAMDSLLETLAKESVLMQNKLKWLGISWKDKILAIEEQLFPLEEQISFLKEERKRKSSLLQQEIFEKYHFLNALGQEKSLGAIFSATHLKVPPAGAGECAAPKLLQYAYNNNLKPIAMAEFWWGTSPNSEVRKHQQFYPACIGKCQPILDFMLQGVVVEDNPFLVNPAEGKQLEILFEDEFLLAVNKPAEFLSVPGINVTDSVESRMRQMYPAATGPLLVHRLDMSTSGIMLVAKTKEVHKILQSQFIKRTVEKQYLALLEGEVAGDEGWVDLPLRVDLDDRPRQLVCYEYGKKAKTKWKVIEKKDGQTRIHFWPITGRTHQLRVHASHVLGLNAPIVGDDIYGNRGERLCLHAASIKFRHPYSNEEITLKADAPF